MSKKEDTAGVDVAGRCRELEAENVLIKAEANRCKEELSDMRTSLEIEVAERVKDRDAEIARLKEISRSKDDFIRITNHELRTPLDAMRGNLDMVLKGDSGDISPKTKEYLEDILTGADRLAHLVNDTLDISRIETGRMKFTLEDVDMTELLGTIENEYMHDAHEKHLLLRIELPSVPFIVFSDRSKIFQIFNNLIGNAFKFTRPGGSIMIGAVKENDMVVVSVKDGGIGISAEDKEKLFHRFPQIDVNMEGDVKGSGLGLHLVWQILERLGGKVWAESEGPDRGTTFFFRLPCAKSERAAALARLHESYELEREK